MGKIYVNECFNRVLFTTEEILRISKTLSSRNKILPSYYEYECSSENAPTWAVNSPAPVVLPTSDVPNSDLIPMVD